MHRLLINTTIYGYHIELLSYTLFLVLGMMLVVALALLVGAKRGLPPGKTIICLLVMGTSMVIGSRILYAITNAAKYRSNPMRLFELHFTGFALYGGLILALVGGVIVCRLVRVDIWRLLDSTAPALGLGIAVVRVGCFLNGCCFGISTSLPWGVSFPIGSSAYNYQLTNSLESSGLAGLFQGLPALHPTQLYEMLAALAGSAIALLILRRKVGNGVAFLSFALWFTAFRWFDDGLRVPGPAQTVSTRLNLAVYGALVVAGVVALIRRLHAK